MEKLSSLLTNLTNDQFYEERFMGVAYLNALRQLNASGSYQYLSKGDFSNLNRSEREVLFNAFQIDSEPAQTEYLNLKRQLDTIVSNAITHHLQSSAYFSEFNDAINKTIEGLDPATWKDWAGIGLIICAATIAIFGLYQRETKKNVSRIEYWRQLFFK